MVSIKKKQRSKKDKLSQKQQQTVIVNIDKRRRARNIKQELLKEQQQKLQQLQAISQMRSPEFQELNIKLKDLEKEKENSLKREEEAKKNKLEEDKKQAFIKAQEEQLKKYETNKKEEESRNRQEELKAIQEKLKLLSQQFDKKPEPKVLGEEEQPKVLGKEEESEGTNKVEEKPKEKKKENYITIPPNKRVKIKPIFIKKEEEETKEGEVMPIATPIEARPIKQLGRPKGSYNLTLQEYNYYIQNTPLIQVPRNLRKYGRKQYESISEIPIPIRTYVRKKIMEGKAEV